MNDRSTLHDFLARLKLSPRKREESNKGRCTAKGKGRRKACKESKDFQSIRYGPLAIDRVLTPVTSDPPKVQVPAPASFHARHSRLHRETADQQNYCPGHQTQEGTGSQISVGNQASSPPPSPPLQTSLAVVVAPLSCRLQPDHDAETLESTSPVGIGKGPSVTSQDINMLLDSSPEAPSFGGLRTAKAWQLQAGQEKPAVQEGSPDAMSFSSPEVQGKAAMDIEPKVRHRSRFAPPAHNLGNSSGSDVMGTSPLTSEHDSVRDDHDSAREASRPKSSRVASTGPGSRRPRARTRCISQSTRQFLDAMNSAAGVDIWGEGSPVLSSVSSGPKLSSSGSQRQPEARTRETHGTSDQHIVNPTTAMSVDAVMDHGQSGVQNLPSSHCWYTAAAAANRSSVGVGHVLAHKATGHTAHLQATNSSEIAAERLCKSMESSNADWLAIRAAASSADGLSMSSHWPKAYPAVPRAAPCLAGISTSESPASPAPACHYSGAVNSWVVGKQSFSKTEVPSNSESSAQRSMLRDVRNRAEAELVYKPFPRQQEAMNYAESCNQDAAAASGKTDLVEDIVKCWCEEQKGRTGYYRSFLAASYPAFWRRYADMAAHARHCYEVIQLNKPCHLYYDLEFSKVCNPGVNGEQLVDLLIHLTRKHIRQFWELDMTQRDVVELDSSTEEKFSRHLVIKLPGHAFESNIMAGSFVKRLITRPEAAGLIVRKSGADVEESTLLVDTAVYTKNRHFRVIWSSKGGKQACLMPTHRFASPHTLPMHEQFLGSLVCNVEPTSKLLALDPVKLNTRGMFKVAGSSTSKEASGLTCEGGILVAKKSDEKDSLAPPRFSFEEVQGWAKAANGFVEEVARQRSGGELACVRTIAHCGSAGTVAYSMLGPGAHFCENIGRAHKSNYIYFVVNFVNGHFCQKCHDPDCKNFRSAWMQLPQELCPRQLGAN